MRNTNIREVIVHLLERVEKKSNWECRKGMEWIGHKELYVLNPLVKAFLSWGAVLEEQIADNYIYETKIKGETQIEFLNIIGWEGGVLFVNFEYVYKNVQSTWGLDSF